MFGVSLGIFREREKEEAGLLLRENLYLTLCLTLLLFMVKKPNAPDALGGECAERVGCVVILSNFYSEILNLLEISIFLFLFSY